MLHRPEITQGALRTTPRKTTVRAARSTVVEPRPPQRPLFHPAALALRVAPLDALVLALLFLVFPLRWEHGYPYRLWVIATLTVTALIGVFIAGGFRTSLPVRRLAAVQAAFGLFFGLVFGWLLLRLLAAKFDLYRVTPPSLETFSIGALVAAALATFFRLLVLRAFRRREHAAPIVVLGPPETTALITSRLSRYGQHSPVRSVGPDELRAALTAGPLRALVLGSSPTGWTREMVEEVALARAQGLDVTTPARFLEDLFERTPLDTLDDSWLVLDEALTRHSPLYLGLKRITDLVVGALAVLVMAPLMLLIAALVRLTSPGPVLYRQTRAGLHRAPFKLLKFRTMRADAEDGTGPVWAQPDDPRVTRLGRFLRKARLDELPQLFNVLRGDMSLVGPRPERPELEHELAPRLPLYLLRHLAKPGLTGWAQVRLPYGASLEDSFAKLEHDIYYLKHASLRFDLEILFRTIPVVVGLRGQ